MNNFDLKNRTAIITGGAQGFGLGIAKKFIQSGAEVIIWDIDVKTLELTQKELTNLYSDPEIVIKSERAQRWAAFQIVKIFLGIPIVPGK